MDDVRIEEIDVTSVSEAVDLIKSHGLTFESTGNDWAGDPDGSQIVDYGTARREETSAHFGAGWPDAAMDAVIDAVG